MPAALHFRPATRADRDAIIALVTSAYRGDASRAGWTTEADLLDGQRVDAAMVSDLLARPGTVVRTARRDGRLVACCELEHRADLAQAYFGMFAVDPHLQGGGIGSQVLDDAEALAAQHGAREIVMTVIEQRHDLIAWYERRGYRRTGETAPFPYGDERFGRPKRPDLQFVVLAKPLR